MQSWEKIKAISMVGRCKRWIFPCLVFLAFLIFFFLLIHTVPAAPNSSDVEYYYEIGLKGLREPFVLNRYFHIYLQRIFTVLAPSPLEGLRYFWAFLFSATTTLIFVLAYKISRSNGLLLGLLGVTFFLASQIHIELVGIPLVDVTAMLLSIAIVTAYVYSLNPGQHQKTFLIIIGILAFLGFKSKETTLPVFAVLLIFGWQSDTFVPRSWWQRIRLVLLGVLIGMVLFGILNLIFVNDFFFGLKPSDYMQFFKSYVSEPSIDYIDDSFGNWYYSFWLKFTFLPFIFYLLSGFSNHILQSKTLRILWVIPLAVTAFIILSVNTRYGFNTRFLIPAIPIVCALAPQIFEHFSSLQLKSKWLGLVLNIAILLGLALASLQIISKWAENLNLDLVRTYSILILPLMFTLTLTMFFVGYKNRIAQIGILASLLVALAFPVYRNIKEVVILKANSALFEEVTRPISGFLPKIIPSVDMLFCIETSVLSSQPLGIAKNLDEITGLFDILSGASTKRENFHIVTLANNLLQIENNLPRCTYVLLPRELQSELDRQLYFSEIPENYYDINLSSDGDYIFYAHNE